MCELVLIFSLYWTTWYSLVSVGEHCQRNDLLIWFDTYHRIVWIAHGDHGGSYRLPDRRGDYQLTWREDQDAEIEPLPTKES